MHRPRFKSFSRALCAVVLTWLGASCITTPYRGGAVEPQEVEAQVAERFALPDLEPLSAEPPRFDRGFSIHRGVMRIGGDELRYRYCLPDDTSEPRPFLLVLPILAGGQWITEQVCESLAQRGIAAGSIERRWKLFREHETIEELEAKLVRAVRQQRAFLHWIARQEGIDGERLGCFGMSMGGMLATMLAAVEPRIDCSVICLAGGDFATLALHADEIQVERWVEQRCIADDIDGAELEAEIRARFGADPLAFAPALDPRRVLYVTARYDGVIPRSSRECLWRALGKPERIDLPLGHYSTILALEWVVARGASFASSRFDVTHGATPSEVRDAEDLALDSAATSPRSTDAAGPAQSPR